MNEDLIWKEESRRIVLKSPVFNVEERICRSPKDTAKTFTVLGTPDWAITIPVLETERGREFIMVRQWRHGAGEISLEFPGGVFEPGEDAATAAVREMSEETGYIPGKIEKLGEFSPNPAIMSNRVYFFIALDLKAPQKLKLDEDEYVEVETVPWKNVMDGMGKPPYIHALMGTAMALYLKHQVLPRPESGK